MFVISSTYTRAVSRDEPVRAEHLAFVERCYQEGHFIASGPRQQLAGGVIIARGDDLERVQALMSQDPFLRDGVVSAYDFIHFRASRAAHADLIDQ
ncbi:hypothetical protein G8767_27090 [Rhodococcus sp. IC4_135]|uniref:YciI family protein n=1 Tax=Rhodococcus sp. IC4_135 TaxID=2715537 RepID=UPI00142207C1|nr:hypothetical protein [Rhodococcus sp. IC4_135]